MLNIILFVVSLVTAMPEVAPETSTDPFTTAAAASIEEAYGG